MLPYNTFYTNCSFLLITYQKQVTIVYATLVLLNSSGMCILLFTLTEKLSVTRVTTTFMTSRDVEWRQSRQIPYGFLKRNCLPCNQTGVSFLPVCFKTEDVNCYYLYVCVVHNEK